MAAHELSSTRRHVLGAAAAFPILALTGFPAPARGTVPKRGLSPSASPARVLWNRRLARYSRIHARWKTEAESGAFRAANDEYNRARADLIVRFGSWEKALRSRTGKPLCTAAFAKVDAAEDAFYDRFTAPLNRTLIQLVETPSPNLSALFAKIELIHEHRLDSDDNMRRTPIEVLRDDARRLQKE